MYHPTTRVLTVLELLQARGELAGQELAERLEVDRRTVRRYVTMLRDLGIPVEATPGRGGGYRLRPGFKLPPLMFTDEEALAVALGLLAARRLGFAASAPAVEGALAKLERVLPGALREQVEAVQDVLVAHLPRPGLPSRQPSRPRPEREPAPSMPNPGLLSTLALAVREGRRVHLAYVAWDGAASERELDPYGLVFLDGRWFTAGYCHLRRDRRLFRLDRIRSLESRDVWFARPTDFDALAFVAESLAKTPNCWTIEVVVEADLATAQALIPIALFALEPVPGAPDRTRLRSSVGDLDWIARELLGLCVPFEVVGPEELRAALRKLAARALELATD
jgi:predicted DNA-binding transcriptional regulator YafY